MAGAGIKKFVAGDTLTAADTNTYLMDQTVQVYDASANRDAAFGGTGEPTLAEGMVAFLKDSNILTIYNGSAWVEVLDIDSTDTSKLELAKDSGDAYVQITSAHDTEATTSQVIFRKADGSNASPALVDDNAVLGTIKFQGYDGNSYANGAVIQALVDGTPADGDMPTELIFQVTPDGGSETPVTALTIKPTGESRFTADNDITDFTADNHGVIGLYNSDGAVDDFTCLDFIGNGAQVAARIGMKYASGGSQLVFGTTDAYADGVNNESVLITAKGYLQVGDGSTAYSLDANMDGPIRFNWAGYTGAVIGNTTGMFFGHNSSSRVTSLVTDETERLRIGGSGKVAIRDDATPTVIGARLVTLRSQTSGMIPLLAWAEQDVGSLTAIASIFMIGDTGDSTNPDTGDYWALFRRGNGSTIGSIKGTGSASVNFATTSDQTMKNDLGDAGDVSSIIDALKIHKYTWKDADAKVGEQIGVFAQEVLDVTGMPYGIASPAETRNEVVETTIDKDGNEVETKDDVYYPASIDYGKLVPLLVQEIKSLRVRVAALEA
jgi:hypothetical protein